MSLQQKIRDLVVGPPAADGKTDPKRLWIVVGALILTVVILTVVTDGQIWLWVIFLGFIVGFYGGIFVMLRRARRLAKQEESIRVLLSSATEMSTYDLADRSGLSVDEVEHLLPRMIAAANSGKKAVSRVNLPNATSGKFLKNAKLDLVAHRVTLDPHATDSRLAKLGATASAVLRRSAPAAAPLLRPGWRCEFCRTTNAGDADQCVSCRAGRPV